MPDDNLEPEDLSYDGVTADDGPPDLDEDILGDDLEESEGNEPESLEAATSVPDQPDREGEPDHADSVQDRAERLMDEETKAAAGERPNRDRQPEEE
ncbi:MAG TPA: hypothetical protein VGP31_11020, partial [Planosporangium sp.]|nr:hypothetical protein [Planosporangium sp.]